jgi:hypothetical protein
LNEKDTFGLSIKSINLKKNDIEKSEIYSCIESFTKKYITNECSDTDGENGSKSTEHMSNIENECLQSEIKKHNDIANVISDWLDMLPVMKYL